MSTDRVMELLEAVDQLLLLEAEANRGEANPTEYQDILASIRETRLSVLIERARAAIDKRQESAKPRYTHDCSMGCEYLGQLLFHNGGIEEDFDLYYCPQGGRPTLLARYGDQGPEYLSGPDVVLKLLPENKTLRLSITG